MTKIASESPVKSTHFGNTYDPNRVLMLSNPIDPQSITTQPEVSESRFVFDKDSLYTFKLNLALYCDHQFAYDTSIHTIQYSLQLSLRPVTKPHNNNDDIEVYTSDEPVFKSGSFILDCDPSLSYGIHNKFIPLALRNWVPPFLIDYRKFQTIEIDAFDIYGTGLTSVEHQPPPQQHESQLGNTNDPSYSSFSLILQSPQDSSKKVQRIFTIDVNASFAQFTLKLTGFRYFMAKYFYTFYFIGSLIFYCICCVVTFVTGIGILFARGTNPAGTARTR